MRKMCRGKDGDGLPIVSCVSDHFVLENEIVKVLDNFVSDKSKIDCYLGNANRSIVFLIIKIGVSFSIMI